MTWVALNQICHFNHLAVKRALFWCVKLISVSLLWFKYTLNQIPQLLAVHMLFVCDNVCLSAYCDSNKLFRFHCCWQYKCAHCRVFTMRRNFCMLFLLFLLSAFEMCSLISWILLNLADCPWGSHRQLKLSCDDDYPEKTPSVRFQSRIIMRCVNHDTGVVLYLFSHFMFMHAKISFIDV
jgi:hypothetical protein